ADYRWVFVIVLMTAVTANGINPFIESLPTSLIFGLMTTLVFFASILIHELAHAYAARLEGVQVLEIMLHPFGGMSRLGNEPKTPRAEFRIAIAGPVASFALALIFVAIMAVANAVELDILVLLLLTLALGNFLLAVFNLFPGYPLDGGRVLRAYLWQSGKDLDEATILTGRCGQVIAAVMITFGLFIALFRTDLFTGFWTILVGLFLYDAAKGIINEVRDLEQVRVGEIMQMPRAVSPEVTVLHFVDNILPMHRRTVFPIAKDRQLYGMLLLADMKTIRREDWHKIKVSEAMRAVAPEHFVETRTRLHEARELMGANGIGAVGVLDKDGNLVGFLCR
ncbi:MAG: site-2 protease family protein, partial [Pyrinomonadaceae bacterium]